MTLSSKSNPSIVAERWSSFYNKHRHRRASSHNTAQPVVLLNIEEDRNRLRTLRHDWLTLLRETPCSAGDWPTTKTELDQLMLLLRWDPSNMWKITKEAESSKPTTSARDTTTGNKTVLHTSTRPEPPVTVESDDQAMQHNPSTKRNLGDKSHHTTTLRPSVFPFAYIRTFYNKMDVAYMQADELKTFAYEQSLKQIDVFYTQAANYCKRLQKALQHCQTNLVASKLYDAFERDHQVLADNLNRQWILAVNGKMRQLGITLPVEEDMKDDLIDERTNLQLAEELLKGSMVQKQSIFVTTITDIENVSQGSSSSSNTVRPIGKSDEKTSHTQFETKPCRSRPYGSSNEPKHANPIPAHELTSEEKQRTHAEFAAAHRGTPVQTPNPDNLQHARSPKPIHSVRKHNEDSEIWQNQPKLSDPEFKLRNKAFYRANHPGWNSSKDSDYAGRTSSPVVAQQLGVRSTETMEIRKSTPLPNHNEIHDSQQRVPNFTSPQQQRESHITTAGHSYHRSGTPAVETESLSHSIGRRPGCISKRSEPEKPSRSFSASDAMPSASDSNVLASRQQRSRGTSFPSIAARSNESAPYTDRRELPGSKILQEPGPPREKTPGQHGYPASDSQNQQVPSGTSTADINWQALNQQLEHMIEKIYADDAKTRADLYSRKLADPNHDTTEVAAAAAFDEEGHRVEDFKHPERISDPIKNSSTALSAGVNIDRRVPYVEDSMSDSPGNNSSFNSNLKERKVCWGKETVYRIDPEVLHNPKRMTTAQGARPRSAMKKQM